MANRAHHPHSGWRAVRASHLLLALALSATACSAANGIQTSPTTSSDSPSPPTSPTPTVSSTSQSAAEHLVTQRYVDFQRVVAEAGAASNPDDPRLAEYSTGAVLADLRGKLAVRRQSGTRLQGAPVPHVQSASVGGDRATVQDCLDNSTAALIDKAGAKLAVGRARQQTTATLVLMDGVWKVSDVTTVAGGGSC